MNYIWKLAFVHKQVHWSAPQRHLGRAAAGRVTGLFIAAPAKLPSPRSDPNFSIYASTKQSPGLGSLFRYIHGPANLLTP